MNCKFYSVSFSFVLSFEVNNNSFNFAHSIFLVFVAGNFRLVVGNFMQVRRAKETTSEINEELQARDRISN